MTLATFGLDFGAGLVESDLAKTSLKKPSPRAATVVDRRCSTTEGAVECMGSGEPRTVGLRAETATTENTMAGLRIVAWCCLKLKGMTKRAWG